MVAKAPYMSIEIDHEDRRIAARLLHLRSSLDIIPHQLADALNITTDELRDYEQAYRPIPASLLALASLALGVDFDYFYQETPSLSLSGRNAAVYSPNTPIAYFLT